MGDEFSLFGSIKISHIHFVEVIVARNNHCGDNRDFDALVPAGDFGCRWF